MEYILRSDTGKVAGGNFEGERTLLRIKVGSSTLKGSTGVAGATPTVLAVQPRALIGAE